ncbi:MAG TPA: LysR family transcriptional regulator [Pseudonocardia sp.]|uniref:LysR family transcriptional regulator n=1 Tax=Pseudonocardia sp. TaxID=60912 RepID=UPI002CB5F839|nr:LysR family transcriptional regulator [Pseudonocardia sp.]HTF52578.1 LysR family transcriptional regulator [Pseudonocardia sp.]
MLNPIHLRTLRECVRTGSFAEAARELGYTASAVSQQMILLERSVGAALFERSARSVRPTAVAAQLAERSGAALGALSTLEREVRAMVRGEAGSLRLASFATANARIVPTALAAVVAVRPNAEVQLDEGEPDEVLDGVLDGALDAAVVFDYDRDPRDWPVELRRAQLLAEPFALAVAPEHRLAGSAEVDLAQAAEETWICTRADTSGARSLVRLAAEAGFTPRIVFRSNDYGVVRELVARNLGVAMLPALAWPDAGVSTPRLTGRQPYRRVLVLYRPLNTNPMLPLALDCLTRACAEFHWD